ncbi:MAG: tetratricopeptide repeat protein [Flavobacteriales bacterium]|nr:MAG: tetratricopeptide repeat protein [Flavobacteriales bacterium]
MKREAGLGGAMMCGLFAALLWLLPGYGGAQSVQLLLVRGDSLLDADKPQRALVVFDEAVRKETSVRTLLSRARAYSALKRNDRFVEDIDKALRLDSTAGEAHYQRGAYALRVNDSDRAEFHGTRAILFARDARAKARAHNLRGEARAERKQFAAAIEDLAAAWAGGLEEVTAMRTLAQLYDVEGRHEEALRVLERLCEMDPSDLGNWTNRAHELNMLGRFEDALPITERALGYDADEPVALSHKAYALAKLERDDEAWTTVERSLRNYPSNPYALRTRAILRLRRGDRAKACDDLSLARALADIPEVDRLAQEHCASQGTRKR